jgi:hypothetical protein
MHQQINLYQPIFRRQRKLFSAVTLMQIALVCLVVLSLFGGFIQFRLHRLQASEQALAAQYTHLSTNIETLKRNYNDPALIALDARITALETSLDNKRSLFENMSTLADGTGRHGFSPYLAALTRQRISGLWLTGIQLSQGGREAQLLGMALEADLIPRYLQVLLEAFPRQSLTFRQVEISRHPDDPNRLAFVLQAETTTGPGASR